jgi:sugar lactone lactonase YvrE
MNRNATGRRRRGGLLGAAVLCASLAALAFTCVEASARTTHEYISSLTPPSGFFANPVGIAINQGTGEIYVNDYGSRGIYAFQASGAPDPVRPQLTEADGSTPFSTPNPFGIAVDNTSGPNKGDIYVSSAGAGTVTQFDPEGKATGLVFSKPGGFYPVGVAVADNGDVYVADDTTNVVNRFDSNGNFLSEFGAGHIASYPNIIATDAAGNVFVANNGNGLVEFDSSGACVNSCTPIDPAANLGVAVDSAGNVYASEQAGRIAEFNSSGTEIGSFAGPAAEPPFGSSSGVDFGIAISESTGNIYVSDIATSQVYMFGPAVILPNATTGSATNVQRQGATLTGHVDPDGGSNVTGCHFDYGADTSYALGSVPCLDGGNVVVGTVGNPIGAPVDVHADLSGLQVETAYHYRLAATDVNGTTTGHDQSFTTANAVEGVTTGAATNVTGTGATLGGSFTGDGIADTHYYFEYGRTEAYGSNSADPPGADAGSGAGPQVVTPMDIGDLQENTTYHYRLVVSNEFGDDVGQDETFTTKQHPTVDGLWAANVTATTADLTARINPHGFDTTYHFEYGTTPAYGSQVPEPDADIGSANSAQTVSAHLTNLEEGATYHFRVVAQNVLGTTITEDKSFNFFPPNCPNSHVRQQTGGEFLPDCRAYELVSPSSAGNVVFFPEAGPVGQDATSPARFGFGGGLGAIEGTEPTDSSVDSYVATRTDTGWTTHYVGIPGSQTLGSGTAVGDLGFDKFIDFKTDGGFPGVPQPLPKLPYVWSADGSPLGRWPADIGSIPGGDSTVGAFQPSPDFSHLAFSSSNVDFTAGQAGEEGLTTAPGSAYDYNTRTETINLISRDANGQYIQQQPTNRSSTGEFILFPTANEVTYQISSRPAQMYPGVSTNGSHILMSTANSPFQGFSSPLPLVRLYMRVDDAVTYEVSHGQSVDFVGMAADGSKVLFTSDQQLTADDHDTSTDLYMWSEATDSLVRLSTGDNGAGNSDACSASWTEGCGVAPVEGMTAAGNASETDNSFATGNGAVYFYSPEQLDGTKGVVGQRNLYVYRGGQVEFVTTLAPDKPVTRIQVSPDGAHAAFVTASRVTSSDNAGFQEMYSFEPSSGALVCVSCEPRGNPPSGNVQASVHGIFMSNDGRTFFYSPDALVPQDTNGLHDVYEFVEGRPQLITSGLGSSDKQVTVGQVRPAGLEGVSGDGVNVYFSTYDTLVPQDRNGQFLKFYDARTGGGFPIVPPATPCAAADECHGAGNSLPEAPTIASEADLGAGGNAAALAHGGKRHHRHRRSPSRRGHRHTHSVRPGGRRGG